MKIYMSIATSGLWVGQQRLWIQQLATIEDTCNVNSSHRQNDKVVSVKGISSEQFFLAADLQRHK